MKKFPFFLFLFTVTCLQAQENIYIHRSDRVSLGVGLTRLDTVRISTDGSTLGFRIDGIMNAYHLTSLDSLTFGSSSDTVDILFSGNSAAVINPFAFDGVQVDISNNAGVTIRSEAEREGITYRLSGTCSDGFVKLYSESRFNLLLDGISLTCSTGPAINIQSKKDAAVILAGGTSSILTDGTDYTDPPSDSNGDTEDQDAAFFSEGDLLFSGSGTLVINGKGSEKHGLCSDDRIEISEGTILVNSADKDAIHAKEGITISGGTITVSSSGDGIDGGEGYFFINGGTLTVYESAAGAKALSCDSIFTMNDGSLHIYLDGDQAKGISAGRELTLNGGTVEIISTGDAVLEASGSGYDPSYCTAVRGKESVLLGNTRLLVTCSGLAGRGISAESDIVLNGSEITISTSGNGQAYINASGIKDAFHGSCLNANGNIHLNEGTVNLTASGSGSKGITVDGSLGIGSSTNEPVIVVNTTGSKITVSSSTGPNTSSDYDESKAISCNGAVEILNGDITISSADDGIKSETSISISTASLNIIRSVEAVESPVIIVNSGNIHLVSSDDGFNATRGNGSETNDGSILAIYGGYSMVSASGGDGIDSNGNFTMTGGTVLVHGPQSSPEVGMDVNGTKNINGGLLLISGTNSNMTEAPSTSSTQYAVLAMSSTSLSSSTLFHVEDSDGNDLFTFQPLRSYYSMVFSLPSLVNGKTYRIYTGGSCSGTVSDGLYSGGSYTGGTLRKSFTISGILTNVNF